MFLPMPGEIPLDPLADRMRAYEAVETGRRFTRGAVTYARLDGRSFTKFTRGLTKPYDARFGAAMLDTARVLVESTHPRSAYAQSDEISLLWLHDGPDQMMLFDGKAHKLHSVLAALATAAFHRALLRHFGPDEGGALADRLPHFDARVCQLPSRMEATNMVLWREQDGRRNAINGAARAMFSAAQVHRRTQVELLDMMDRAGVRYEDYPEVYRRGALLRRSVVQRVLTEAERSLIPEAFRPAPDEVLARTEVEVATLPVFGSLANREAVLFDGAAPVLAKTAMAVGMEA